MGDDNPNINAEQLLLNTDINYQPNIISDEVINSTNQIFNVDQIDFSSTLAWIPVAQEILNEQSTNNSYNEKNTVFQDNFDTDNLLNDLLLTIDAENINQEFENNVKTIDTYDTIEDTFAPKTLKDITADADICKCIDCKCDVEQGCQGGCGPENACKPSNDNNIEANNNNTETYAKKKCCGTNNKAPLDEGDLLSSNFSYDCSVKCSCKSISDGITNGCCVVICLKTFESLQSAYNKNYKAQMNFSKHECQIMQ